MLAGTGQGSTGSSVRAGEGRGGVPAHDREGRGGQKGRGAVRLDTEHILQQNHFHKGHVLQRPAWGLCCLGERRACPA